MLVSLPESYDSLVTALESRSEDKLALEIVKSKLISDFKRKHESDKPIKESTYMDMYVRKPTLERKTCYGCGKHGHFID